jgi:hypothetical protein
MVDDNYDALWGDVDLGAGLVETEADNLFFRFVGEMEPGGQVGAFSESESELEEDDAEMDDESPENVGDGLLESVRPTDEDLARWNRCIVSDRKERVWKAHGSGILQSACFAVEWRASILLDKEEFLRRLFLLVGEKVSFILGCEIRESRADYTLLVRMQKRVRWKSWKKLLMFGHASKDEEEDLFMRVRVPLSGTDKDVIAFVKQMTRRCDAFENTSKYREEGLVRRRDMSFARPGRRRRE